MRKRRAITTSSPGGGCSELKPTLAAFALVPLGACAIETPRLGLRLEDRPAHGSIRIVNPGPGVRLYYPWLRGFGGHQMFALRYRDARGRLVRLNGAGRDGWWSIKGMHSDLGEPVVRRPLDLPANGVLEFSRDVPAIGGSPGALASTVEAPCTIQFAMDASLEPGGGRRVAIYSGWSPEPCPPPLRRSASLAAARLRSRS